MKIERDEFYWRQQSEINSIIAKQAKELEDMVGKFSQNSEENYKER